MSQAKANHLTNGQVKNNLAIRVRIDRVVLTINPNVTEQGHTPAGEDGSLQYNDEVSVGMDGEDRFKSGLSFSKHIGMMNSV